ncbi:phosphatase PAP2 family protein [Companilactobacillus furfuricola]|uniref:phosphatase PAP2 family protein n=1 Tax=Companilactobacillus furfuricola TaxID=1462575 RepID=UPI000F77B0B2|nr:phosphatase PAP2 family protein [Companilactobacillus furfuricola]
MIFQRRENRGIACFALFLLFFLLMLAVSLQASWLFDIDKMIQHLMTIKAGSLWARFYSFVTLLGSPVAVLIFSGIMIAFFIFIKERVTALWIAFTILDGYFVAYLFKILVHRARPHDIVGGAFGFSFPSGHVFGSTILVLFILGILVPRIVEAGSRFWLRVLMIVWLIIVVISRIYLRVHYPSDVLGSLLLAFAWWKFSQLLYLRFYQKANAVLKDE